MRARLICEIESKMVCVCARVLFFFHCFLISLLAALEIRNAEKS